MTKRIVVFPLIIVLLLFSGLSFAEDATEAIYGTTEEFVHPNNNMMMMTFTRMGLQLIYSRDFNSNFAWNLGLGRSWIRSGKVYVSDIDALYIPALVRYYFLSYRHRPFLAGGVAALVPTEKTPVEYITQLNPVYPFIVGEIGYEFRALKGFVFQAAFNTHLNFSDHFNKKIAFGPMLALGWSF